MKHLNKYVITLLIAAAIYLFVGEQSLVRQIHRRHQIHQIKGQIEVLEQATEQARRTLDNLQNTDSLERFAREQYYMHAGDEDVYVIDN